jgi:hypothetical protein
MAGDEHPATTGDEGRGKKRGVIVFVPEEIRAVMHERRTTTDITFTELALDAIEDQADALKEVFLQDAPTRRRGSIFERSAYQNQREARRPGEVQINLQLLPADIAKVDKLWMEAGARSRNRYVATALQRYLQAQEG